MSQSSGASRVRELARFGDVSIVLGGFDGPALARQVDIVRLDAARPFRVVVQKGRSFQRANPDVPVIVDRGRYLIVELPAERDVQYEGAQFTIAEADAGPVGFRVERAGPGVRRPEVVAMLEGILADQLRERVVTLAGLRTRHSRLPTFEPALTVGTDWLRDADCDVERTELAMPGGRTANLVGRRHGSDASPALFVIGAHLDSINHEEGPDAPAPGADDNASGAATVAALAKAIKSTDLRHDVHFVLFGGEEQGLFGSKDYVAKLTDGDRVRLGGVINIDMAASRNTAERSVLLEGAPISRPLIDGLARAAATYTSLITQVSLRPFDSDHVPFIDQGLAAVLTIEGTDSAFEHEHTGRDTPDRLDFELHREITAMNLAWLVEQAV